MTGGLIEKPTFLVHVVFPTGKNGEVADADTMCKFDTIFVASLTYLKCYLKSYDSDTIHSDLFYSRHRVDTTEITFEDGALFSVYLEDSNGDDNRKSMVAKAVNNKAELHVPKHKIDQLPVVQSLHEYSDSDRELFGWFANHIIHEVLHILGAYHHHDGIMSGYVDLIENGQICLVNRVDDITTRIVSEMLSANILATPPVADYHFNKETRCLTINGGEVGLFTVVFLKEARYTKWFYFCSDFTFCGIVPEDSEWDRLFVQFVHGAYILFEKNNIYNSDPHVFARSRLPGGSPHEEIKDVS
ncbi:hypothetical protein GCK72_023888 [Caenorhabditis remanei]|uniref:Uncharacterized protein n=2 Tax=Caenorhabditis remanei TaxID=31234 RepID=E3M2H9_CAERE|nr:hypothetical protein GCK72_023888 [Caenorhabditis remanei]EFO89777.1 hypothetical protein CRE_07365 [Caenorhabditis remanei]KAF1747426.1 hypothetical protein GCK72_023888 [Caenorhabditis remanei]